LLFHASRLCLRVRYPLLIQRNLHETTRRFSLRRRLWLCWPLGHLSCHPRTIRELRLEARLRRLRLPLRHLLAAPRHRAELLLKLAEHRRLGLRLLDGLLLGGRTGLPLLLHLRKRRRRPLLGLLPTLLLLIVRGRLLAEHRANACSGSLASSAGGPEQARVATGCHWPFPCRGC
jgi:hypothetical protein